MRKSIFIALLLTSQWAVSQSPLVISKTDAVIAIDGAMKESSWEEAIALGDFRQLSPNVGATASSNLVVKLMYDQQYLYIGCDNTYENPDQLSASTLERDSPQEKDDYIEIHLDTYNDKINTLLFRVNPLGTRQDIEISRNGEEFNTSWNTFWDAKSQINDKGWSTEIRIPFTSLRFSQGSETEMRIKAIAKYKLKNELVISPLNNSDITNAAYHFSNSELILFKKLESKKPLFITPYVKGNIIRENTLNDQGTAYTDKVTALERKFYFENEYLDKLTSNIGIDLKFKPAANQTLDITFNTDFAEIEADDREVNISRFPILLAEKRLFFLENADLFNSNLFDHKLFNSRAIGIEKGRAIPIIAGLRFTGSNSKWQYGFLNMQTHQVEDVAPSHNMSVVRLRRNFGQRGSNIGILNTNKINHLTSNHLVSIDGNINFTDSFKTRGTVAVTIDKESGKPRPMYGIDINTFKTNGFGINHRFREYSEYFNPELGFLRRPNTRRLTLNHGWRKTYPNAKFLRILAIGHYFTKYWTTSTGHNESLSTNMYLAAVHKKGSRLTLFAPVFQKEYLYENWQFSEGVTIPVGGYEGWRVQPIFTSGNSKAYQLKLEALVGHFYGGNLTNISYNFGYELSQNLKIELGGAYNRIKFPNSYITNVSNRVNISRYFTRIKYNFSSKGVLNSYFQYNTKTEKIGLNLRFRYNPKEGTDLFLVYNHNANANRNIMEPRLPFTNNQVFILKFSQTIIR